MSDQHMKDAIRRGVMKGLALGPGRYDPTSADSNGFLIDTIYEAVVDAFTPETPEHAEMRARIDEWMGNDGWQLARDVRAHEAADARRHERQIQYEDGEWSREIEVWEEKR